MTRRDFLWRGAAAAGAATVAPGCMSTFRDFARIVDDMRVRARIGVIASPHVDWAKSCGALERALRFFDSKEVRVVVLVGDLTESGKMGQFRNILETWRKVFKGGFATCGHAVTLLAVTGRTDRQNPELRSAWKSEFGYDLEAAWHRSVGGVRLVGANCASDYGIDFAAAERALSANGDNCDESLPVVFFQHFIPRGTCCRNELDPWVVDDGRSLRLLSKHRNVIAVSGASHTPLTDESCACDDSGFVSVNASAVRGVATGAMRENGRSPSDSKEYRESRLTAQIDSRQGFSNALLISVYSSNARIERWDLIDRQTDDKKKSSRLKPTKVGPDWVVEFASDGIVRHTRLDREKPKAPQFWSDTRVVVMHGEKQVEVSFPSVLSKFTGVRAYDYLVVAESPSGKRVEKRVYSPGHRLAEHLDVAAVSCVFSADELLPLGERVRFGVTPTDAFGNAGRTVWSE